MQNDTNTMMIAHITNKNGNTNVFVVLGLGFA